MTGRLSRREMLGVLGGIGTGALAAGFAPIAFPEADAAEPGPKRQWAQGNEYNMPRPCFQCENAPCLRVCPVAATFQTGEGVVLVDQDRCIGCRMCMAACPYGARYFNYNEPPGHQHPFQHPTPEHPVPQQKGTVGKCMFCVHRTEDGKLPACVDACGMGALYIGDLVEDVATNGQQTVRLSQFIRENDAFRYKEELGTGPRVYYIAGHGQLWES
ncbi:MAG: 4Fe-4S dicluster domain-containing protein [Chloroflexi bacterium]|nr:MAG: 4Fe-4S dicluster domain-containing protein [Chloroflexota bacterium]